MYEKAFTYLLVSIDVTFNCQVVTFSWEGLKIALSVHISAVDILQEHGETEEEDQLGSSELVPQPHAPSTTEGGHRIASFYNNQPFGLKSWSTDEVFAFLLGVKVRHGLSDEALFSLMEGENASLDRKTVSRYLPVSLYRTGKQLDGLIPFTYKYVTYCPKCESLVSTSSKPLKEAECTVCGDNLSNLLSNGGCHFVILPVRKQIEQYCLRPKFQSLIRKFSSVKYGKLRGPLHDGLLEAGHFSLTIATDGATLSKWSHTTLFPIFLFFNNLPVSYQVVYPVLCALYCGHSRYCPPRHVFFKFLVEELRELEQNHIVWTDDTGVERRSLTYVTLCCTDAVEKAKVMNHKGHGGYYSCPYCKYEGENVQREATSLFPRRRGVRGEIISGPSTTVSRQTHETGRAAGGGRRRANVGRVKYPKLLHEGPSVEWRDPKERVAIGEEIVRRAMSTGVMDKEGVQGVMGLGVINGFARFSETDSHTPGILHIVCEGILKDIMNIVIGTVGEPYSLKKKRGTWDNVERLMDSRSKVSEANFNCKSPRCYKSWRAYDFYQLLIHDVALLFSDEQIITDEGFQKMIFQLSEAVYLLCHGRMDDTIRGLARAKVQNFSETFKKTLGPEWCTYKFHVFQHLPDLADRHGPAFLWDDFNLERMNNLTKQPVKSTRGQMEQAAKHFILRHHSDALQDPSRYRTSVQDQLKRMGFHQEAFYSYDDFITHTSEEPLDLKHHEAVMKTMVDNNLCEVGENVSFTRVTRMVRKNVVVLTSKKFKHKGRVRDSYVQIMDKYFGQIEEIVFSRDVATFFIVLEKFVKYEALYAKGNRLLHPFNQFPYRRTGEILVFELTDEMFIQKAQISCLVLAEGTIVNLFSPRPNEFFRF